MNKSAFKTLAFFSPLLLAGCNEGSRKFSNENRPNILIAIGDDISFPHMGAYGTVWVKTPGFDRVAENGILFRNAYTPNSKSSPSRACFLTGRNSWQLEEGANHIPFFPPKFRTFMETLADNGYHTGYTAKGWSPGIALDSLGNQRLMTGKAYSSKVLTPPSNGISNNDYAANFGDFLDSRQGKEPFCFWYGSAEPHRPYEYGSGVAKYGESPGNIPNIFSFWPDNDIVRNDLLDYALEIEHFDSHLAKMLAMLEGKGELDNTIVIVTADNGMPFPRVKGQAYEYSNHIPLAIMWGKGIKNPGRTIYDLVSFIDFAPTFLDIAGIDPEKSGMKPMQGRSLTDIFFSKKNQIVNKERNYVIIGKERHDVGRPGDAGYPIRGIVSDGFLFIKNYKPERWPAGNPETGYLDVDGSPTKSLIINMRRQGESLDFWKLNFGKRSGDELYNLGNDPDCIKNLANDAGYNSIMRRLSSLLYNKLLEEGDPRAFGNGDVFDTYPYAQELQRDFYNKYKKGDLKRKSAGWVDSTDFETDIF